MVLVVPSLELETLCFQNSRTNFPTLQKRQKQPGFGQKDLLFDTAHIQHAPAKEAAQF